MTQVLGGWLAQKLGGKAVLGFGVLWWSAFTILTPLSAFASFPVLIATRIAMGLGEGVAFRSEEQKNAAAMYAIGLIVWQLFSTGERVI